jgi:hypothetical protein
MLRASILGLAILGWASGARADAAVAVVATAHVEVAAHVDVVVVGAADPAPAPAMVAVDGGGAGLTTATPLSRSHWEAGIAMTLPLALGDVGLHAAAGRAFGPLRLAGEYTLGDASADRAVAVGGAVGVMADCGQRQRLGVAARYRVDLGLPTMGTGVYVEAGVGRATTAWKSGFTSTRDDMLLGVGFELLGGDARVVGMDLGMRVTIAEPEQPGAAKDTTGVITVGLLLGG